MNYKKILVVMFILCLSFNFYGKGKNDNKAEVPTNVQVIAQSGTAGHLHITVIDLDNNEVVLITYGSSRHPLIRRTGMFVNPNTQPALNGTDAPFENED